MRSLMDYIHQRVPQVAWHQINGNVMSQNIDVFIWTPSNLGIFFVSKYYNWKFFLNVSNECFQQNINLYKAKVPIKIFFSFGNYGFMVYLLMIAFAK